MTHSEYAINYELKDEHWTRGGQPSEEESYCSPWLLNTIKSGEIQSLQGSLVKQFTDELTRDAVRYLETATSE